MLRAVLGALALVLSLASANAEAARVSWYGGGERLNSYTSTGERFNANAHTCAHRTLPLGTRVLMTYRGRSIVVRVNDRGPAARTGREFDVTRAVARELGFLAAGTANVDAKILNERNKDGVENARRPAGR